jgi:hypothetical protein
MSANFYELLLKHMHSVIGYDLEDLPTEQLHSYSFTPQELAFIKLYEELYYKFHLQANVNIDEFNQQLHEICQSYLDIIYKDFFTRFMGYIFTILSFGLALFSKSFCDTFFTNSNISNGIEYIVLNLKMNKHEESYEMEQMHSLNIGEIQHHSSKLTHRNLIDCAKKLGYSPNDEGICYGFSMRWIEASILGVQDKFYKRLQKIYKLNKLLSSGCPIDKIQYSPIWKNQLLDIRAFFDSLMLYQSPAHYPEVLGQELAQDDVADVSKIASSEAIMQLGGLLQTQPVKYGSFQFQDFKSFLQEIENVAKEVNYQDPLCVRCNLYSPTGVHSICLIYHPKSNDWQFMDVNQMNMGKTHFNLSNMSDDIPFDRYETYCAQLVLTNQNHAEDLLHKIEQIEKLNEKKQDDTDSKRQDSLLFSAIKFNDAEVLTKLLSQVENPNIIKAHGITPLIDAVTKNRHNLVKILLDDKRTNPNQSMSANLTPLMISIKNQNLDIVNTILANELTDPNLVMNSGFTALIMAVAMNCIDIAKKLASDGRTKIDIHSPSGLSAIDIAENNGFKLI